MVYAYKLKAKAVQRPRTVQVAAVSAELAHTWREHRPQTRMQGRQSVQVGAESQEQAPT